MKENQIFSIESSALSVACGEDKQANPGISGQSLAQWLGMKLRDDGIATADVVAGDFGS
jgi:hypothetical protein